MFKGIQQKKYIQLGHKRKKLSFWVLVHFDPLFHLRTHKIKLVLKKTVTPCHALTQPFLIYDPYKQKPWHCKEPSNDYFTLNIFIVKQIQTMDQFNSNILL